MKYETIISLADVHRSRRSILNGLLVTFFTLLALIITVGTWNFFASVPHNIREYQINRDFAPQYRLFQTVLQQQMQANDIGKLTLLIIVDQKEIYAGGSNFIETEYPNRTAEVVIEYDTRRSFSDRVPMTVTSTGTDIIDVRKFLDDLNSYMQHDIGFSLGEFAHQLQANPPIEELEVSMFGLNLTGNRLPLMALVLAIFIALQSELHLRKAADLARYCEAHPELFDEPTLSLFKNRSIFYLFESRWFHPESRYFFVGVVVLSLLSSVPHLYEVNLGLWRRWSNAVFLTPWGLIYPTMTVASYLVVRRAWAKRKTMERFF